MPLPVIHTFAGYSIYKLSKKSNSKWRWIPLCVSIFLANLPDLDFLPGVLAGEATLFHRGFSHSLMAAFLCGLLVAFLAVTLSQASFKRAFLLSSGAYLSHVLLDLFSAPVTLFWPFSSENVSSPVILFMGGGEAIHQISNLKEFIVWFLSPYAMHMLFFEMAVVFSIWALVTLFEESRKRVSFRQSAALVRFAQDIIFFSGFILT